MRMTGSCVEDVEPAHQGMPATPYQISSSYYYCDIITVMYIVYSNCIVFGNNNFIAMHNRQISEKVNKLKSLLTPPVPTHSPISLISLNSCRDKKGISHHIKYKSGSDVIRRSVGQSDAIRELYESRCRDIDVAGSEVSWDAFLKVYTSDNPLSDDGYHYLPTLNYSRLALGKSCTSTISAILKQHPHIKAVHLSCSTLKPSALLLQRITQLTLMNCGLNNEMMDQLFLKLKKIGVISKLCLSSPQINNRNVLTKYQGLISLINSTQLNTLELSNVGISADCNILQASKASSLRKVDLSHNTKLTGINLSITYLDISHNGIVTPFPLPLPQTCIEHLCMSYNEIPSYHLKLLLKSSSFPYLTHLDLSHMHLEGELSAIQSFLEHSNSLKELRMVACELDGQGFVDVMMGVKGAKVLQRVDLSRNRINSERIAQAVGLAMHFGCFIRMRLVNCEIRDQLGGLIFNSLNKNKRVEELDLSSNFLGELTSKALCKSLQLCLTLVTIHLKDNPINYKQQREINGYLSANKHWRTLQLRQQMSKLQGIEKQIDSVFKLCQTTEGKLKQKQIQLIQIAEQQREARKSQVNARKVTIMRQIFQLRHMQDRMQMQISKLIEQANNQNPQNSSNLNQSQIS